MTVELTAEMAQLWASLRPASPMHASTPQVIQFVAATTGEGTSTVAREFARFAAARAQRPVWLVESDLMAGVQHRDIGENPQIYGPLGRQTAASPDGSAFFTVQPPALAPDGRPWPAARYLVAFPVAHPMGGPGFWVTRFRREVLRPGQAPQLLPTGEYWAALRRHAEFIVIDSPSADHSTAARTLAPLVDTTVLVLAGDRGDPTATTQLKAALIEAGGQCAGVVLNRADAPQARKGRRS
jgi:Mrp family chromosome partitioning ATPase